MKKILKSISFEVKEKRRYRKLTAKYNRIRIIDKNSDIEYIFNPAWGFGRMDINTRKRLCSLGFKPKYRMGWVSVK